VSLTSSAPTGAPASAATSNDGSNDASTTSPGAIRRLLRPGHPGLVLALILTSQLMVVLDATIVNIALPQIHQALGFSTSGLSWVVNAYTLTFGGLLLLGARAGDLLGRRRTFVVGLIIFTLASLAGGFATTPALLLAARAAQGVGGALASPSALALLMTMFRDGRERTRALGLYTAVSIGGAAVGLIAGGLLTQYVSWRWVLFVNVPIGLVVIALTLRVLPETPRRTGRFDIAGALTSTVGMGALVYGFVHAATAGWHGTETLVAFGLGVVLLAAFVFIELRASSPITPLRLFADRSRSASYLARLLLVAGMMGMFFFLTQFLQGVLGYSPLKTGLAFLPLTVMVFTASQVSARVLTTRYSTRTLVVGGITVSTFALLWISQLGADSSYYSLLGPLVLFGLGNGTAFVPLTAASLSGVEPADAGAASGLVNVMQQVGGSLGLAVLVTVYGAGSRSAARDLLPGSSAAERAQHAFVVGADRSFLAAAIFLAVTVVIAASTLSKVTPPRLGQAQADEVEREVDNMIVEMA
jgi:EmrB/QacA subfamily drug resistance transporter